jgi:DNA gyrase subunit B
LRLPDKVRDAEKALRGYMETRYPDLCPITVEVSTEVEHGAGRMAVSLRPGASARVTVIDWDLVDSAEYQELLSIEEDVRSIGKPPYTARTGSAEPVTIPDAEKLADFIDERGRKGIVPSRWARSQRDERRRALGDHHGSRRPHALASARRGHDRPH